VTPFVTAGAGFLLAVLWFDLMFDVQVRRREPPGEEALASIAGYYARATTGARPMNRLVALVMLATLGSIIAQLARGEDPRWVAWASLALTGAAVVLAAAHTVPAAVRLGTRRDPIAEQGHLAQSILRDHLFCLAAIAGVLVLQLAATPG